MLCLVAPLAAYSAGLGKLTVLSPLGQPLVAEIEIVSMQPGEEEGLTARLASLDAFKQAGIDFNPALVGMRFAVERRAGRGAVLKVTTSQPVNEPFVDLLVELSWSTGRLVREYTFLLDPQEYKGPAAVAAAPAQPAVTSPVTPPSQPAEKPVAQPKPAEPAAAAPAAGGTQYEVKRGDTLAGIARQHMAPGVTLDQMLIAIYRANQEAFIRDNVNLVRSGKILNIPAEAAIDAAEARQLVQSHQQDFNAYRASVAAAPASAEATPGRREVTGRIEPKPAPAPQDTQDQLRLSKADPKAPSAPGGRAARGDDQVARERALNEAQSRVTDLEKNVADLQKLLELKNQQLAQLEQKGATKPAPAVPAPAAKGADKPAAEAPKPAAPAPAAKGPEAPKPAAEAPKPATEAPKPAAEAPKPAAEAPKPAAEAPKPAAPAPAAKAPDAKKKGAPKPAPKKAAPPPPEPSLIDEFLDNPLALGALAGVLVLLAGYGAWAWRRKKASQAKFQDSVLDAASGAGAASFAPAAAGAAAAGVSQASVSQAPAGMEAEEVDPIAEADVYMAYGRDAQAEEILKEALAKDASRTAVHAKLLEIYANRKDAKSFEQTALKLKGLTNGSGPDWDKAAALGRTIDPANGLYSGSGAAAAPVPEAPAAAPMLDFDLGSAAAQAATPDISLDETTAKESSASAVDFDLGAATQPPKADTDFTPEGTLIMDEKPADTSAGLDFDLGLPSEEKTPPATPAAQPAAAADSSGLDFDFNLDMGGGEQKGAGAPAQPAATTMDLSAISLDLGSPESSAPAGGGDPKWQEVATKLDLAKAYEEMGDKDGARELLNEVMKDGDSAQKGQAQQLLAKL